MKLIDKYYQEGFRQFHCSNTIPVKGGGLSGQSLIKDKYKDTIIIGGGGIKNMNDIYYYKVMGADHFHFQQFFPIL